MTATQGLREAVIGLTAFAALEEELLLASAPGSTAGSPERWAAVPIVAHNTEFRREQVQRLEAIRSGGTPPDFPQIDHRSSDVYERYRRDEAAAVIRARRRAVTDLIDAVASLPDADLLDPGRHPWLRGRQLWLDHRARLLAPAGPRRLLPESQPARPGRGPGCAGRRDGQLPRSARSGPGHGGLQSRLCPGPVAAPRCRYRHLQLAIGLNPDLRANAASTRLARLRRSGQLDVLLAT